MTELGQNGDIGRVSAAESLLAGALPIPRGQKIAWQCFPLLLTCDND